MKPYWITAALLLAAIPACGSREQDNQREIERQERGHDFAPTYAVDEAIRTEAVANIGRLKQQLQYALLRTYGGDTTRLANDLGGTLDAAKLKKINMTENDLRGQNYVAGDYTLTFSGSNVTITTTPKGTRGHVSETVSLR